MLIDTHCHLTYPGLAEDVAGVLGRARGAGVARVITIGTHPEDHPKAMAIAKAHPAVFLALGIHPHHAGEAEAEYEGFMENILRNHPKVVALGECGLDYHYDFAPKLLQKGVFTSQLEMARRLKLPAVLHVREAHADALSIARGFPEVPLVVHCFTGTPEECQAWLDLGATIGFTGIVTYKNAADVAAAAKLCPANRILVETDAPYLSPEPVRTKKPNEPAFVAHTAAFLAELRGTTPEEIAMQTTANAARVFGDKLLAG